MKKIFFVIVMLCFISYFLMCPIQAIESSKNGLMLWFTQLLPALLPFTVFSYVILRSNILNGFSKKKTILLSPEEFYVICCGFLFGFPIGSKLTTDLYRQKRISKEQAELLFVFSNNLSPVFISSVLKNQLHITTFFRHFLILYGIPLLIGCISLLRLNGKTNFKERFLGQRKTASRFEINMQIVDAGIIHGFETLIKLCGYIILFSILSEMIMQIPIGNPYGKLFVVGFTEVTNGMSQITHFTENNRLQYLYAIFFLSWGGLSGFFQTASIVSSTDLSMKQYLKRRLSYVTLSVFVAYLCLTFGIV